MRRSIRFPIRLKILVTLLVVVTVVVSIITFTMANMFHEDKSAYITDLTSITALSVAEETRSILLGYVDRMEVYSRIVGQEDLSSHAKSALVEGFFQDVEDLVGIFVFENGEEVSAVLNSAALGSGEANDGDLAPYRLENQRSVQGLAPGQVRVRNSTVVDGRPTFTLSLAHPETDAGDQIVIAAVIQLDALLRVADRSSVFDVYLVDDDGRILADRDLEPVVGRQAASFPPELDDMQNQFSAGIAVDFMRDDQRLIGGYATVEVGGVIASAEIPHAAVYLASRQLLIRLVLVSLVLLVVAVVISELGSGRITRPLERLMEATREIGQGRFDVEVRAGSRDEIGSLGRSFNRMASELKSRDDALDEAQRQLIQSEKMAAFGQIGAGIAHEVKNPLAGILGCAQLALRKVEGETPIQRNLLLIEKETRRCKTIVENLLKFARQEKTHKEPLDVNVAVEEAASIVNHQMELNKVKLETQLGTELPQVVGNANQLQQVVMNLLINAQQAMGGEPGSITLTSRVRDPETIEIVVADSGPGIPEDIQRSIFEPFFTTKPGGKGTGLGLSVSFGIVKDHGGQLLLESAPGEGATFRIVLPKVSDREANTEPMAEAA